MAPDVAPKTNRVVTGNPLLDSDFENAVDLPEYCRVDPKPSFLAARATVDLTDLGHPEANGTRPCSDCRSIPRSTVHM